MTVTTLAQSRAKTTEISALTGVLSAQWYPILFQIIGLVGFGLILYFAFTGNPHGELNFATVFTWRLWWALLPLSLFLFGKVWCAICPLALLSDLTRILSPIRRVNPRFLREHGVSVMAALFVTLSWAHAVFDIHGTPWITGVVFVGLAVAAILLSVRFHHRTFCRFACPVGLMSGMYAMLSPLALRANGDNCDSGCDNNSTCRAAPICKLYEYPRTMDSNRNCVLCGDCVDACSHQSPQMIWRAPTSEIAEIRKPIWGEAVFAFLLLGLVLVEIIRMTPLYPAYMQSALAATRIDNYILVYTISFAALLSVLTLTAIIAARTITLEWKTSFARFSYAFLPLAFTAHLGTNLYELVIEGTRSIQVVINNLNLRLVLFDLPPKVRGSIYDSDPALMMVHYTLIALGLIASLIAIHRIARQTQTRGLPYAAMAVVIGFLYLAVYALPMKPGC
jgi:polyferredoxin